jgi:hypothetical protein
MNAGTNEIKEISAERQARETAPTPKKKRAGTKAGELRREA